MNIKTNEVLDEVLAERERQDAKWGQQNHEPAKYFAILSEEHGESAKEVVEATFATNPAKRLKHLLNLRDELIQTAAVACAMVECLNRHTPKWAVHGFKPEFLDQKKLEPRS